MPQPESAWLPGRVKAQATFRCARCHCPGDLKGRRLMRVQGLRQWVCAACALSRENSAKTAKS